MRNGTEKNREATRLQLLDQICAMPGRTSAALARVLALTPSTVRGLAADLTQRGWLDSRRPGGTNTAVHWHPTRRGLEALKANFGPGHRSQTAMAPSAPARPVPITNSTTKGTYTGAELRPFTDRPGANDHMQCGSVAGGRWVPYAPPTMGATGFVGGRP